MTEPSFGSPEWERQLQENMAKIADAVGIYVADVNESVARFTKAVKAQGEARSERTDD